MSHNPDEGILTRIRNYRGRHPVTSIVILVLIATLVGLVGGKAFSAEPTSRQCAFSNPDLSCQTPHQLASKFRHHKIRAVHGLPVHKIFANPKVGRQVIVAKTVRYLKHHPSKRKAVKRVVANYHAAVTSRTEGKRCCHIPTNWITECHVVCLSTWSYARARAKDNCAGDFLHNMVIGLCTPGTHPMTKKELQVGGAVTICGGVMVFGVVTAAPTAGAGTVAAGAGLAGLGCAWGFWSSVDPG